MNKISSIAFKKLKRISPSQFNSMKNCAYKSLLAEAFDRKPLLPLSPNAYLGTVLHKILELIVKGYIKDEQQFKIKFDNEILLMEATLERDGYDYLVPLQMNVRDFGMKKIQLKKHLRAAIETPQIKREVKFLSEGWYESKDKNIGGKIDLIIEEGAEIEIIDFKTGAITEDVFDDEGDSYQTVKKEYQDQLKLYAYVYFDSTGNFPTQLCLVDLTKQKFNIPFSKEECQKIFEEAELLLKITNNSVDSKNFIANPNESNCKFCLYRPACSFYLDYLQTDNVFNDVYGSIEDVVKYNNGNISVYVMQGNNRVTVTGFDKEKYEYFNSNKAKQVNLFNLRKEATQFVYSATRSTMIYEA